MIFNDKHSYFATRRFLLRAYIMLCKYLVYKKTYYIYRQPL